ncbi:efflux RND transporter periplasmic adaptor subunit [Stutzerimonas zhaodongensis]|uniref:Efflux RND transporter periplasmic adaptor subunit n=1 Tax=Stutzerimonas zhaodongensis TaxID=1176257 RepID=A0A3M2HVZ4_9GAMM|nr:efflux RND transporter periplasmic adaptor subunit [Stutzerimonas zhaodongensis]MCQ2031684.1 efflux RND transporter periplasmic adaptor subunit [Stutzerimonas zhaodongensis]MCQ4316702.1 efflux RND transporter periplasmic adaptor subunit [Stutzerimonas zhaodongensis]RMH92455.1 efflux RND transporter periplasmic adaptor subunit [Stutzerimonas zhaodongensis]
MRQFLQNAVLMGATALLLAACSNEEQNEQPAPPPPEVEVMTVEPRPIANIIEIPGRVQAVRIAEIRARVNGIIQKRLYEEGTDVDVGTPLFQIDPREMRAELKSAEASLERAKATAQNAAQDVKRYEGLVAKQAISQQEYDTALATLRTARADVSQAEASVQSAELNLEYTTVTSPIEGRAGRAQITEGALVNGSEGTLLTTVEQFDPVYVNFAQSSSDLLRIRAQLASGELELSEDGRVEVRLILENGSEFQHPGYINFYAMSIDETTGTVAVRAQFPNPDRLLLPGQFVRARVNAGTRPNGVLIPQRAVVVNDQGARVLLVGEDDKVASREVELGDLQGSQWLIREGLEAGDVVIVEGGGSVRSGAPVRTVAYEPETPPQDASDAESSQ